MFIFTYFTSILNIFIEVFTLVQIYFTFAFSVSNAFDSSTNSG